MDCQLKTPHGAGWVVESLKGKGSVQEFFTVWHLPAVAILMDGFIRPVTLEEAKIFQKIDRELYTILVEDLLRNPTESIQVMGLWLWFERLGYSNAISKILSQPVLVINELADEATACLKCLDGIQFPLLFERTEIPVTRNIFQNDASLKYFHINRHTVYSEIQTLIARVYVPVLSDIMEKATLNNIRMQLQDLTQMSWEDLSQMSWEELRQLSMQSFSQMSMQGSSQMNMLGSSQMSVLGSNHMSMLGSSPSQMSMLGSNHMSMLGLSPSQMSMLGSSPSQMSMLGSNHMSMLGSSPNHMSMLGSRPSQMCMLGSSQMSIGSVPGQMSIGSIPSQMSMLGSSPSQMSMQVHAASSNPMMVQPAYENPSVQIFSNNNIYGGTSPSPSNVAQANEPASFERTMFATFSKGYPVSESEIRHFFARVYGNCIESVHMQEVRADEQALYARVVFHSPAFINSILTGLSKAKFSINGKHVWMRRFVPNSSRQ